ncbi:MAG: glycosyltransferase family 39 protein [Candidatus Krumholzibacteriia bacterium]
MALAVAAAAVAFLVFGPLPGDLEPLPWDMSHHMLGARTMADALVSGNPGAVWAQITAGDLYPPGHSLLLGGWLALCGDSTRSWLVFQLLSLLACLLAVAACACEVPRDEQSVFTGASLALLLATPLLLTLSSSFLVEAPVAGLVLLSLAAIARLARAGVRRATIGRGFLALLAVAATLLTKYNAGLPLVPALLLVAAWSWRRGERPASLALLVVGGVGVLILVGFLGLQQDGWRFFFEFARNRANALDQGPLARLAMYAVIHVRDYSLHAGMSAMMVGLAALAVLRRREPLTLAAAAYVVGTLAALAMHPYVLGRNLFVAALVLAVLAGRGFAVVASWLERRRAVAPRFGRLAGITAAVLMLAIASERARDQVERQYHGRDQAIATLSDFLAEELTAPGSCRVVGTFNECSAGWVELLRSRGGAARDPLRVDFPYPLARGRDRLPAGPDPHYRELVDDWFAAHEDRVILITVDPGSPWWTEDYARYGAWKLQVAAAIAARPELATLRQLDLPEQGLHARVLGADPSPVVFGAGWGAAESWGRWALGRSARLHLQGVQQGDVLHLRFAAFEGAAVPARGQVFVAGQRIGVVAPTGPAWRWQDLDCPLPADLADGGRLDVVLRFDGQSPVAGRLRAMPFAEVALRPRRPVAPGQSSALGLYLPTTADHPAKRPVDAGGY